MRSPSIVVRLLIVLAVFGIVAPTSTNADIIADSLTDWSSTGTQGEKNWFYGWRNFTGDGGEEIYNDEGIIVYDPDEHFIPFINDDSGGTTPRDYLGERPNLTNNWTGNHWRLQDAPGDSGGPWTELFAENSHPNGINSTGALEEHWTIRRWVAEIPDTMELELRPSLAAVNLNGPGTTIHLFQNGELLDTISTNSGTEMTHNVIATVFPGDLIDIALTPEGGGDRSDGSDGSKFRLVIDDEITIPPTPPFADSFDDWSATGTQGENNWFNGYYNLTQDDDGVYEIDEFIPFENDGSNGGTPVTPDGNHWNGNAWDLDPDGAPWTSMGNEATHPNGTNNGDEHWTIRRYIANDITDTKAVEVQWHTRKTNVNGTGVTGKLLVNGEEVASQAIAGNDGTGFTNRYYVNAEPGDIIELAHTPIGPTDDPADGSDGSANRLTLRDELPDGPLFNPNGEVYADSVAEFSGEQGENNFFYGFYNQRVDIEESNEVYDVEDFIPFFNDGSDGTTTVSPDGNHWNGNAWDLDPDGAPWTTINANGGHPTATNTSDELHWAVRRWVVEFDDLPDDTKTVRIDGTCGNANTAGEGTTCRIFVDGEEIWTGKSNDGESFAIDTELSLGSVVDFAIDPDGTNRAFDPDDPLGTFLNVVDGSDGSLLSFRILGIDEFLPVGVGSMCDFDGDGVCGVEDINLLMAEAVAGTNDAAFDLNSDGVVDDGDRDEWLAAAGAENGLAGAYLVGDADLSGVVDAIDLNAVALSWQDPAIVNWTEGNFVTFGNGVDAQDLNGLGGNWRQSVAPAAASVPEPAGLVLLGLGVLALLFRRR